MLSSATFQMDYSATSQLAAVSSFCLSSIKARKYIYIFSLWESSTGKCKKLQKTFKFVEIYGFQSVIHTIQSCLIVHHVCFSLNFTMANDLRIVYILFHLSPFS